MLWLFSFPASVNYFYARLLYTHAITTLLHDIRKVKPILRTKPTSNPNLIYLRDGEVVVYRRSASPLYQCRYKLADGQWHRQSTRKASVEKAVSVACLLYDEARFRQKLGLAHKAQTFLP